MKVWVDGLLKNALSRQVIYPEATFGESTDRGFKVEKIEITAPRNVKLAAVPKKPMAIVEDAPQDDDPWVKRPFWDGNRSKKVDTNV